MAALPLGTLSEETDHVSFCDPVGCLSPQREERLKWKEILVWSREHLHVRRFNPFGKYGDLILIQVSAQAYFQRFFGNIYKHHGDRALACFIH